MQILRSILDFVYPPLCRNCNSFLELGYSTLCLSCFQELELASPQEYCQRCFGLLGPAHHCPSSPLSGLFSCCIRSSLSLKMLQTDIKATTTFLLQQYSLLPWPSLDLITITPGNRSVDHFFTKREQTARELSALLCIPYLSPPEVAQERLTNPYTSLENQGTPQDPRCYTFKRPERFINKKILIIHDILKTGISAVDTGRALKTIGAGELYTLCMLYE